MRLHGRGEVVLADDPHFPVLAARLPDLPGACAVIRVDVTRVADSCGFAVPLMEYRAQRALLPGWAERRGPDGLTAYRADRNAASIDGLPAL